MARLGSIWLWLVSQAVSSRAVTSLTISYQYIGQDRAFSQSHLVMCCNRVILGLRSVFVTYMIDNQCAIAKIVEGLDVSYYMLHVESKWASMKI